MTVRVKICGITRLEDALLAERLGAFAVGFVFHPPSRRFIEPAEAGRIARSLGSGILKVGVFVDEDPAAVRSTVETAGLTAVQLHGSEGPSYVRDLGGVMVIKTFRVGPDFDPDAIRAWPEGLFLLDTAVPGSHGGTGRTFDWRTARACGGYGSIIVAGGLTPENVAGAVQTAEPWGVDVSGGVESSPGVKDHGRMRAFFSEVRRVSGD